MQGNARMLRDYLDHAQLEIQLGQRVLSDEAVWCQLRGFLELIDAG